MITAICSFPLRAGLSREQAVSEMKETLPMYRGRAGLVRKYICIDLDESRGCGIYLWENRQSADSYFAAVIPAIRKQLGADPQVAFFDTPVIVDNGTGEVIIEGQHE